MRKFGRIGILGGSFNPIHYGHLVLAEQARDCLGLEKVIFVPMNLPPHKSVRKFASAKTRYQMVAAAIKSNPYFEVSDSEIKRGGISYSIETAKEFKSIFPRTKFYFIVGSDFLEEFSMWKDIAELSRICKFAIAQRPGYEIKRLPRNMCRINVVALDISSTDIRRRIKNRQSIRYLVPEEVRRYILKKRFYL